jgi:hypothetical protein
MVVSIDLATGANPIGLGGELPHRLPCWRGWRRATAGALTGGSRTPLPNFWHSRFAECNQRCEGSGRCGRYCDNDFRWLSNLEQLDRLEWMRIFVEFYRLSKQRQAPMEHPRP